MHYLENILIAKKQEILLSRDNSDIARLEEIAFNRPLRASFYEALSKSGPGFITEFKRKSPSKGWIHEDADPGSIIRAYEQAGASAVSVLTDKHFAGSLKDLSEAALHTSLALLRKDFFIDKIQILEAAGSGASAILLIAAVLSAEEIKSLTEYAHSLSLDVLLEIHHEEELEKISAENRIIGINNRNLSTFRVDIEHSIRLSEKIPNDFIKVSESGLDSPEKIRMLYENGFDAFLIGESFMKTKDPGKTASGFINEVNK